MVFFSWHVCTTNFWKARQSDLARYGLKLAICSLNEINKSSQFLNYFCCSMAMIIVQKECIFCKKNRTFKKLSESYILHLKLSFKVNLNKQFFFSFIIYVQMSHNNWEIKISYLIKIWFDKNNKDNATLKKSEQGIYGRPIDLVRNEQKSNQINGRIQIMPQLLSFSLKIYMFNAHRLMIYNFRLMKHTKKVRAQNDLTYSPHGMINQNRRRNRFKKHRKSFWKFEEQKLYVEYLQKHQFRFSSPLERKKSNMFVQMTNFIKIRGPDQCRSHHQKMLKKYGSVAQTIKGVKRDKLSYNESACPQGTPKQDDLWLTKKNTHHQECQSQKRNKTKIICQNRKAPYQKELLQDQIWNVLDSKVFINVQKIIS